ncbi:MarR family winged helix-turn-helix transcriptional regulator [Clavibacter capsici]|uniref:Winged helix-turn-helix transcriptional regulator n=1 Tax=Clavibacter capsici TaxID=1874630 RepID=A0AAE6XNF5_9MICO|nr:MarR family winged helix-turn-helix transcriptional regulator [Clavibacter capsici]ALD11831.1 ArsR family transcriptional regulator [Clavibacter capsici]QIS38190.1 winged helix-turn-helix transcriptional regulator [Clavibacter capsici]QIS43900.1 winged helix-turn-helix transcriptional regulator [Clavibacter capsici]
MTDEERSTGGDAAGDAPGVADGIAAGIAEVEEQMTALAGRIRATTREAAAAIHPELPPIGYKMLRVIRRCGSAHASAVADQLGVDRSVVSRQLRQLQELGLVEVRTDAQDGRVRVVALTATGRAGVEADDAQGGSRLIRGLGHWSRADLAAFAGYLARLNAGGDAQPVGADGDAAHGCGVADRASAEDTAVDHEPARAG